MVSFTTPTTVLFTLLALVSVTVSATPLSKREHIHHGRFKLTGTNKCLSRFDETSTDYLWMKSLKAADCEVADHWEHSDETGSITLKDTNLILDAFTKTDHVTVVLREKEDKEPGVKWQYGTDHRFSFSNDQGNKTLCLTHEGKVEKQSDLESLIWTGVCVKGDQLPGAYTKQVWEFVA